MATIESPEPLSNLYGASPITHSPVVMEFLPGVGVLQRGSIVGPDAGGKMVLVDSSTAKLTGILLNDLDTGATGPCYGEVDRKGAFKASKLITGSGTNPSALQDSLRGLGIYLEGAEAAVAQAQAATEPVGNPS